MPSPLLPVIKASIIQAELIWIASSPEESNEMALNHVPFGPVPCSGSLAGGDGPRAHVGVLLSF
jgi:hypothetical protein